MMIYKKLSPRLFMLLVLFFSISFVASAQRTISGQVTSENSESLVGVTVTIQGQNTGTVTDVDGNYSITANDGNVLVYSYIGMVSEERTVSAGISTIDVRLAENATTLSDVIVSSTRQPVRKLETTTAVSVISSKLIEAARPEGFSEAVQGTPGMYTSQSQGRFRGSVFTRGFPDGSGNGLVYTGILIDGIPSLATPARPPDFAFGMDLNVERIEVVRGSAATLFGRASAAGVINVISRVGGEEIGGTVRVTNYNKNVDRDGFDYKLEGNLNGPIAKNLRYNVGGYYVRDRGFRDLGYDDHGGQFRANIDYLLGNDGDKGSIRLFGGYTNISIQNMIDIPYKLSDNTPMDGWEITDSYYSTTLDEYSHPFLNSALGIPAGSLQITDQEGNTQYRSIAAANEDGNYARGFNVGLNFDVEATDWLIISNKLRYQNYDHGTKFNLGVSTFYFNDPNNYTGDRPINFRILIDGDGNDTDIIDEFRLTFPVQTGNTKHNFNIGTYYSRGTYTPETYSWFHASTAEPDNPTLGFFGNLLDPTGAVIYIPPDSSTISVPTTIGASPVPFGSAARRDKYVINVNSFFIGDEMKIGDKATVNIGGRYDRVRMDIRGLYNNPQDPNSPPDIVREEEHSDFSFSVGGNYLTNERSSIYANFVRAFRMPDYGAYSPADPNSLVDNPRIDGNEIILNTELGYRTGVGDLGIDAAVFFTNIKNRLATIYEGAIATQKPLGTNQILGGELALGYTPSAVKGLLVRGSFTYQKATFQDFVIPVSSSDPTGDSFGNTYVSQGIGADGEEVFAIDLKGNQLPRVPSTIFNLSANYDSDYFGINAAMNLFANRFADATNIYKQDDITNINLGLYGKYPLSNGSNIKLSVLVKNVLNTDKALRFLYVADNDDALARAQLIASDPDVTAEGTYYTGIPFLPRRILISLAYDF